MKKTFVFIVTLIFAAVFFLELSLRFLSFSVSKISHSGLAKYLASGPTVPDKELGWKGNPRYPEHDANGFRNPAAIKAGEAFMIAMGDSQTYGLGEVSSKGAWPLQMEKLIDRKVYNMGVVGSGPCENLRLMDHAIKLRPKIIVWGFYPGNDLFDAYSFVYGDGKASRSLKAEVHQRWSEVYLGAKTGKKGWIVSILSRSQIYAACARFLGWRARARRLHPWKYFGNDWDAIKQEAHRTRQALQIVERPIKTILAVEYQRTLTNLKNPRLAEGLRVSLETVGRMREKAKMANIEFIVLFIPSKESVFEASMGEHSELSSHEEEIWRRTKAFYDGKKIRCLDAAPVLVKAARQGKWPYSLSWDAHLNAEGHRAMAELVASQVK